MYEISIATPRTLKQSTEIWKIKMVEKLKEASASVWAAPILLTLLLGFTVWTTQSQSARIEAQDKQLQVQHDLLIELKTLKEVELRDKETARQETQRKEELDRVYRENMNKQFSRLELIVQGRFPNQSSNNHAVKEAN